MCYILLSQFLWLIVKCIAVDTSKEVDMTHSSESFTFGLDIKYLDGVNNMDMSLEEISMDVDCLLFKKLAFLLRSAKW